MKVLDYINNRNYKLTLEKLIIGVEEPIFIKGVGSVLAKADSGNSAFNVLHGEDFYNQGDVVVFTTYDEEDKPHRVSKKVQGTVDINIGAGHTETRPIVLLDVKFAGEEYINVPFTIGNRANNKNKVLLGKEFLTKELDVLIDVSKDNISDKNIEVDVPVTEGAVAAEEGGNNVIDSRTAANPSGAATKTEKALKAAGGGLMGAYKMFRTFAKTGQTLNAGRKEVLQNWKEMMKFINDYQKTDKELIFKFITERFQSQSQRMDNIFKNPQVIKILDYLGNDFAGNNNLKQNDIGIFKKVKSVVNSKTKTIVYLVIYDGDKVNIAKQVLSSSYQKFNNDFSKLISAAELVAENEHMQTVSNNIINVLIQNDIPSVIVACSGIKENRIVTAITDIFKFVNGPEEETGQEQHEADKSSANSEPLPNLEIENIFGEKLNSIDSKLAEIDYKMATDFIGSYGANTDDIYSYPVFSFTDKSIAILYNAKDTNVNKKVTLYYMVFSKSKPSNEEMAKSLQKGKDTIGKLIPFFDIDSISDTANSYISQFNAAAGQNGILVACFGDETDRRGLFLGGKTEKNAAINPKMLSFDKKRDDKKESAIRQKNWKNFISSLPASYDDYTQEQYNQLFDKVNQLTGGQNNYMVPMPRSFDVQISADKNIQSVTPAKNGKVVIKRKGNNNSIYEYEVLNKNLQKYITLRNIEKPEGKEVDGKVANKEDLKEPVEPEVIDTSQLKDEINIQTPEIDKENIISVSDKVKNNVNNGSDDSEKVTKKKKEIGDVVITDEGEVTANKKNTRKPGRPKGSANKVASKARKVDKNEFNHTRKTPLTADADVNKAASTTSHAVSKTALDSVKNMLLDI